MNKIQKWLPGSFLLLLTCICMAYYAAILHPYPSGFPTFVLQYWKWGLLVIPMLAFVIGTICARFGKTIADFLYKYRWPLAFMVMAVGILLKLNGTSAGVLVSSEQDPLLAGINRGIRSDEYAVFTPMALSQYVNGFAYENGLFRGIETDMFAVYGQAVLHPLVLFRPFQWGYLFLPPAYGLSWFWVTRTVILFMVSFEMGMLLSDKSRPQALAYAALVAFSPFIAWWFAINSYVEMLCAGQALVLLLVQYFKTDRASMRWLLMLALAWCAVVYALALYPAMQVPLAYVYGCLAICLLLPRWKKDMFQPKGDLLRILCFLVITGFFVGWFLVRSSTAIQATMETVYPGQFLDNSPVSFHYGTWIYGPLLPMMPDVFSITNVCEAAAFYSLTPLGLLLALRAIIRKRGKQTAGLVILMALLLLFILTRTWSADNWLAKLTLMDSKGHRLYPVMTYINLLLLFLASNFPLKKPAHPFWISLIAAALLSLCTFVAVTLWNPWDMPLFLRLVSAAITFPCFLGFVWGLFNHSALLYWTAGITCLSILISGLVNPIRSGIEPILSIPSYQTGQAYAKMDGTWLLVSEENDDGTLALHMPSANWLAAGGVPVINSTNVYPNLELWETLGLKDDTMNRYAHISVHLQDDKASWTNLRQQDLVDLYLHVDDLAKMDVQYLYSYEDLSDLQSDVIQLKPIGNSADATLYEVTEIQ